jgi:hypothetical protein
MATKRYPKGKTNALLTIASDSNPSHRYEIRLGLDEVVYCTCPSWKFHGHCCKHMIKGAAGGFNSPVLVNAPSVESVQAALKGQIQAQTAGYRCAAEQRAVKQAAKAEKVAAVTVSVGTQAPASEKVA